MLEQCIYRMESRTGSKGGPDNPAKSGLDGAKSAQKKFPEALENF
jgi:hypothetical protein